MSSLSVFRGRGLRQPSCMSGVTSLGHIRNKSRDPAHIAHPTRPLELEHEGRRHHTTQKNAGNFTQTKREWWEGNANRSVCVEDLQRLLPLGLMPNTWA